MPALPENERTPPGIERALRKLVAGQHWYVRLLALIFGAVQLFRYRPEAEKHAYRPRVLIVAGPPGSGKTHIAKLAAELSGLPFVAVDATKLTQGGYVGEKPIDWITRLIDAAKGNCAAAQRGAVFIDEVFKIGENKGYGGPDVNGAGAQHSLLTLIQGTTIRVRDKDFDTSGLIWILGGAREGMDLGDDPRWIADEVLINQGGLVRELVDRLPYRAQTFPLSRDELKKILVGLLAKLKNTFRVARISLTIPDETVDALLDLLGDAASARAIESTVGLHLAERLLFNLSVWEAEGVKEVRIPPAVVLDRKPPVVSTELPAPESPSPDLLAAREKIQFDKASRKAQQFWEHAERKYDNVVTSAADEISRFGKTLEGFYSFAEEDENFAQTLHQFLCTMRDLKDSPEPAKTPEIAAARKLVRFYEASKEAQRIWLEAEQDLARAVTTIAPALVALNASLENLYHFAPKNGGFPHAASNFVASFREKRLSREQHAALVTLAKQPLYGSGTTCPLTGTYVFSCYADPARRNDPPPSQVAIEVREGDRFPTAAGNKQRVYWQLAHSRLSSRY